MGTALSTGKTGESQLSVKYPLYTWSVPMWAYGLMLLSPAKIQAHCQAVPTLMDCVSWTLSQNGPFFQVIPVRYLVRVMGRVTNEVCMFPIKQTITINYTGIFLDFHLQSMSRSKHKPPPPPQHKQLRRKLTMTWASEESIQTEAFLAGCRIQLLSPGFVF